LIGVLGLLTTLPMRARLSEAITGGSRAGKEVSGVEGGWRPYPGANGPPRQLPRVRPGRVVGIGAICDLRTPLVPDARSQSFSVSEFVTLEDGRRVVLHEALGFTIGLGLLSQHTRISRPTRLKRALPETC
jgi:hypothetical protein